MKIISKYKEYYDYLVHSKYGMDKAVVLDRRKGFVLGDYELNTHNSKTYKIIKLAICGFIYTAVVDHKKSIKWCHNIEGCGKWINDYIAGHKFYAVNTYGATYDKVDLKPVATDINNELNCPIVLVSGYDNQRQECYPMLSNLNISSIISPDEMYINIYNWLSKQKDINHVDSRSDKQKVESHGFDDKKSFRHRK